MSSKRQLPYGIADFSLLREERMAYVDKTRYIAELEQAGRFLFFLRPRRFGKSLTVSMLLCYYDLLAGDHFDDWFSGTWIAEHPTDEKNAYLMLYFNFSVVEPDPGKLYEEFSRYTRIVFQDFLARYRTFFDENAVAEILASESPGNCLNALFSYAARLGLKLYVLIDEYDNFTNTLLSMQDEGEKTYTELTHEAGFFRHFFSVLKGGTHGKNAGLSRLFVTGVSPVTMDDVTSGYNIGKQVSLRPALAEAAGFTRDDVLRLVEAWDLPGILDLEATAVVDLMATWYGGYRFSRNAETSLFNPNMVLYFIDEVTATGELPVEMIDQNVRTDYSKLKSLIVIDQKLNGNFSRLKQVMEDGRLLSKIKTGFPYEGLTKPENFISLLHYLGLVTLNGVEEDENRLVIPNQTVKQLIYGYIRDAFEETAESPGRALYSSSTAGNRCT